MNFTPGYGLCELSRPLFPERTARTLAKMASVSAVFFGLCFGHAAQAAAQAVEERVHRARGGQVLLAPALLRDQGTAHRRRTQAIGGWPV